MLKRSSNKLKIITLYKIFHQRTDEEHPLSAGELCDELDKRGITAERKSIYRDVDVLIQYGLDINKTSSCKKGFYLGARKFEPPEVRMLMDAVLAAKFITGKKTNELINKLKSLLSDYQAVRVSEYTHMCDRKKLKNEAIYYNIDTINRAIANKRKIQFNYYNCKVSKNAASFKTEEKFTMSPYSLVWSNDKYYLVASCDKLNTVNNYRVDKIKSVKILEESVRPYEEISKYKVASYVKNYLKNNIDMFFDELKPIELICKKDFLDIIIDRFGTKIKILNKSETELLVIVEGYINEELIEWLLQNGNIIYVKSPLALRRKILKELRDIEKNYKE